MNIDNLRQAVTNSGSINEVLEYLGYKKNNSVQRRKVLTAIMDNQIETSHFGRVSKPHANSKWNNLDLIRTAVDTSNSITEFLSKMGLSDKGSNRDTARTHLTRLDIDFSHFRSRSSAQLLGIQEYRTKQRLNLDDILRGEHPTYTTNHLKRRLIQEGIKENNCEICGINEWNNKPLTLHLDHINGISDDHRLENLRMLCPNCHSQTETYAGRNKKG